jgi:hypothetical protein
MGCLFNHPCLHLARELSVRLTSLDHEHRYGVPPVGVNHVQAHDAPVTGGIECLHQILLRGNAVGRPTSCRSMFDPPDELIVDGGELPKCHDLGFIPGAPAWDLPSVLPQLAVRDGGNGVAVVRN